MDQMQARTCPFCGSEKVLLIRGQYGLLNRLACGNCGAMGPARAMLPEALSLWNNRSLGYAAFVKPTVRGARRWDGEQDRCASKEIPMFPNTSTVEKAVRAASTGYPHGRFFPVVEGATTNEA